MLGDVGVVLWTVEFWAVESCCDDQVSVEPGVLSMLAVMGIGVAGCILSVLAKQTCCPVVLSSSAHLVIRSEDGNTRNRRII